jgi:SAM-dependent MidA family methyltransferase
VPVRWKEAMTRALYGPDGFFRRPGVGPAGHFRTSVNASPLFAGALARMLVRLDEALGRPDPFDLVDIGAGRGELLTGLTWLAGAVPEDLGKRLRRTAVEVAARPDGLDPDIAWTDEPPAGVTGLLIATEWLDNVPLDIAVGDPPRYLHVDGRPGVRVTRADEQWLRTWWPTPAVAGARAEIGRTRDEAWAAAVSTVDRGLAVAVDYGHVRAARPVFGTLAGHRDGRRVDPVPDGSCDVSAYVAIDAVAAAGAAAAAARDTVARGEPAVVSQRAALRALGVHGRRPPHSQARDDPIGYVHALALATAAAELTDPEGLGGHWWLLQPIKVDREVCQMVIPGVFSAA